MALTEGVDYSHHRPDPACLFAAGKRFVVRYVGTPTSGKNLTVAEAGRLRAAGLDVVAVYETTADFMLQGYDRGARAAREATADAARYGYPTGRPIYYALDIDPRPLTSAQWGAINRFLDGAASVTGRGAVGVYGGWLAIEQLVPENAPFGWQTYAWSSGRVSALAHLYQHRNGVTMCGGTLDLCRALQPDYGQWSQEDDMPLTDADKPIIQAAVKDALKNMTRQIGGVGGGPDADAVWAKWVYDAARESLADPDLTADAVADAVVAKLPAGSLDLAVVRAAVIDGVREVLADAASP